MGVKRNRKLTQVGRKTELKSDPPGSGLPTRSYLGFVSFSALVLEPIALALDGDHPGMVQQAVQQRRSEG